MAIQTIGPIWLPEPLHGTNAAPGDTFWNDLNVANEGIAFVFRVPKTGTLDTFEFRLGTTGNVPDNGLRVSFQDLSGDFPDGTPDQFRDVTSGFTTDAWIVTGLMTSDGTDGGTKRSVTVGDYLAVVIEAVSFTAGDNQGFDGFAVNGSVFLNQDTGGQDYLCSRNSSSVWSVFPSVTPLCALKYSDGTYAPISPRWYPITTFEAEAFSSSSTPDERGMRFVLPVSVRVEGVWFRGDNTAALDVVLYDAGDNVVASNSVDSGVDSQTNSLTFRVPFAAVTLAPNQTYRLVVKPTTTSNVTLNTFNVPGNAYLNAVEGGASWYYTARTDAGAWSDTATKRPWMGLLITGVEVAGTGGGQAAYPFIMG